MIGYGPYVDYCADLLSDGQTVIRLAMGGTPSAPRRPSAARPPASAWR